MSERGLNAVQLLGRVGRDPETRFTQSGQAVANFSLAISERRKKGDQWEDATEWVNCVAWGKTAEAVGKHVTKGSRLHVTGRLQTRKWEKDGQTRYSTEVVVGDLIFLGGGREQGTTADSFDANDDIPF